MTSSPFGPVRCRAKHAKRCEHGTTRSAAQDEATGSWREDGTYLESDDSIVCMDCYIALGTPLNPVCPNRTAGPRTTPAPNALASSMARQILGVDLEPAEHPDHIRLIRIGEDNSVTHITKAVDGWREIVISLKCDYMDVVRLIPDELAMYVDDTGRITGRPINLAASVLYAEHCKATTPIHGPVIFFRPMPDGSDAELTRVGQVAVQAATMAVAITIAARSN